ncbi:RodZ domain-containing protein [Actinomadura sp. KC216]|uniref:RodZ domain-containing protein n=1 Tax=Actinomadura sp. KC216 TaxID=2530370 RepID=UPI001FB64DC7|nr:RodZ domain-containing protein [Actinomadura sp. KC216]
MVNALSGEPEQKGPSTSASRPAADDSGGGDPSPETASSPTAALPLVIRVTGPATFVVVRVADTGGKVLTQGTLNQGETRNYRETPLQVVAQNGGSLQVVIHGKVQPRKPDGRRAEWFVKTRRG